MGTRIDKFWIEKYLCRLSEHIYHMKGPMDDNNHYDDPVNFIHTDHYPQTAIYTLHMEI